MTHSKPLVSIVVTVFNKARYLPLVIDSYNAQQTDCALELIFVDDASTDNSVEILERIQQAQNNIQLIHNSDNAGPARRLDQGLAAATGQYILMVDGDDLLSSTTVHTMLSLLQEHQADLLCGHYGGRILREGNTHHIPELSSTPVHRVIDQPLRHNILNRQSGMGVMITRELMNKFSGCDEGVFAQDISLHLELGKLSQRMVLLVEPFMFGFADNTESISMGDPSQGLHDRILSNLRFFTKNRVLLSPSLKKAMVNTCVSAMWKYHRRRSDISFIQKCHYLLIYLQNKLGVYRDPGSLMKKALNSFDGISQIRKRTDVLS